MRIVDFFPFPDRSEHRDALIAAFDDSDLGDGERTDPIADEAPVGIGFPDGLSDDEVRELAEEVRAEVEDLLDEDVTVRFELSDGASDTAGGSPDHTE